MTRDGRSRVDSHAVLSAFRGSTGSIVAGAMLYATAGLTSSTLAVANTASVGGSLAVGGALSAASLTVGGNALPSTPPTCMPPGASGLFFNGSWQCVCAAHWSGTSCTIANPYVASTLAGGCAYPCNYDVGHYYLSTGTGSVAGLPQTSGVAVNPVTGNVYLSGNWGCNTSPYNCIAMATAAGVVTVVNKAWTSPTAQVSTSGFPFINPSDQLFPNAANSDPRGLAFDAYANLYIVDPFMGRNSAMLYRVSTSGVVTPLTLTWTPSRSSWTLWGVAISGTTIYLTGDNDHCVHNGTLVSGNTLSLKVMAGTCGSSGFTDGTGVNATFNQPQGIAVDSYGNVFVGDSNNYALRKITPAGVVTTVSTTTTCVGGGSCIKNNVGVAIDASNNVFFNAGYAVMKYSSAGVVSVVKAGGYGVLTGLAINTATGTLYAGDAGNAGYVWQIAQT